MNRAHFKTTPCAKRVAHFSFRFGLNPSFSTKEIVFCRNRRTQVCDGKSVKLLVIKEGIGLCVRSLS
jgi:hypothetical protein